MAAINHSKERLLSHERLREILDYDPSSGVFRWKKSRYRNRIGAKAGYHNPNGYRAIQISGIACLAHRLAWLYHHGRWPAQALDHLNGIRDDNRIENLEEVSIRENARRGKSFRGSGLCANGRHLMVGDNVMIRPSGKRECRGCVRAAERARYAKLKAENPGRYRRMLDENRERHRKWKELY